MHDLFMVRLALGGVLGAFALVAWVLVRIPDDVDHETRKVRLSAVTLTGILVFLVYAATLYANDPRGAGREIFDKCLAAFTPLAGAIVGYFFASKK